MHLERPGYVHHTALLHQTAQPEALARFHLPCGDLAGVEIERDILLECPQRQCAGETHAGEDADHPEQSTTTRNHTASRRPITSERRAQTMFRASTATASATEGQTYTA